MAEFSAGAWRFAVQVEMRVANGEYFGGFGRFTDQIEHCRGADRERRAERKTDDRAQMIFELAGECTFDRPVTGVVDARRHFVGEEFSILFEEFDGENADVLEFVEDGACSLLGGALDCRIEMRRGSERETKDSAAMMIFDERVEGGFAGAGAHGDDAEFARERDEFFKNVRDFTRACVADFGLFARRAARAARTLPLRRLRECATATGLCRRSPCGTFSESRAGRFFSRRRRDRRGLLPEQTLSWEFPIPGTAFFR